MAVNRKSKSPRQTMRIGAETAKRFPIGNIFCLYGDLGSGKTVFVKGFAGYFGINEKKVKSPTFTFLRSYKVKNGVLHHFDFYRIEKTDDILLHDFQEILQQKNAWILIEWPEKIEPVLPLERINIHFKYIDETTRDINLLNGH